MGESLPAGTIFDERYVIRSVAGRGGMATVYRAFHRDLGRDVALKVLHNNFASTEDIKRFQQEAHLVSTISHPNITSVTAFGTFDERPYVAFEYLDGSSLEAYIQLRKRPLTFEQFRRMFTQICDGLLYAHEKGIVHRDLKPSNLFIVNAYTAAETIKIVDFGIAKALARPGSDEQKLTATGSILGTPLYMSPEQVSGRPIDGRSDIYALGCIMFYCLMLRPPFDGDSQYAIIFSHTSSPAPPVVLPKDYPSAVAQIIARCLEKDPAHRYQSVQALREDLEGVASGAISASTQRQELGTKSPKPLPIAKIVAATSALVVGAGALVFLTNPKLQLSIKMHRFANEWNQGRFAETRREIDEAYAANNADLAREILSSARPILLRHPTTEGAALLMSANKLDNNVTIQKRAVADASLVLRSMPDSEWELHAPEATAVLEAYCLTPKHGTRPASEKRKPAIAAELINYANWLVAWRRHFVQTQILKHADELLGEGTLLPPDPWSELHNVAIAQGLDGDLKNAVVASQILQKHSSPDEPETIRSSMAVRADVLHAQILATRMPTPKSNLDFLGLALQRTKLRGASGQDLVPLYIAYAEANFADEHKDEALKLLNDAAAVCRAAKHDLVLGACYLPIVGDGYLAQGKRDKAFECYRDALAIGTKAMSNVTSDREAVGAQESIAFAVGHAMLMLGQERRASDLVYRMERVGRRFHTLFEQWAFIVNAAPAVATAIDRQILPGDPKLAETLKDKLYPLINGAAYHAAGGHYHRAIQDLRDASVIANKYGLDPDHTLALHAGLLAAGFGEFPEMGEHCLREVVEKSGYRHNRLHAYYNLAIIYRRQGDFAKARAALDEAQKNNVVANTVGDSPKDALHMKQQIGGQRMLLAWLANDWKQMAADWEAVTAKPEDWDRDWWKKWTEAYSFALRQVGRDEDADRALERKETGPSNGKNSGN